MFLYVVIEAIVGIVAGILLARCTKREENISYGKLDVAGKITNIVLLVLYATLSPFYLFIGMISEGGYKSGFLGVLGWVIAIIIASAALFCGLGLGASVALRKKGKSKLGFAIQFVGVVAIVLSFLLYGLFVGDLICPLN